MDKLLNKRNRIDEIDTIIMELLDERYDLSIEIGNIKKEENITVLDSRREDTIFEKTSKTSHFQQIKEVYKTIMDESKKLQRK